MTVTALLRITQNPVLKQLPNSQVASINVVDNRVIGKNPDGSYKTKPVFIEVAVFGNTASYIVSNASIGDEIYVEGAELDFDQWVDKDGKKMSKHKLIAKSIQLRKKASKNTNSEAA